MKTIFNYVYSICCLVPVFGIGINKGIFCTKCKNEIWSTTNRKYAKKLREQKK
jgi:hypothetical protein